MIIYDRIEHARLLTRWLEKRAIYFGLLPTMTSDTEEVGSIDEPERPDAKVVIAELDEAFEELVAFEKQFGLRGGPAGR